MKEILLDTLKRYREQQILVDSAKFADKAEVRGYLRNIVQTADGIIFINGNGEEILKIPSMITNTNLSGGD